MRGTAVLLALLAAVSFGATALAQEPTPTVPTELPVGEFTVVPDAGPVGTRVTVSGDFDRDITGVRFHCIYRDVNQEGLDEAYRLPQPSPAFSFDYVIPAELSLRQGGGATRPTLVGQCEFLAMAGHQLLTASVPFMVTEPGLPPTGGGPGSESRAGAALAALLALGGAGLLLGWSVAGRRS